MPLYSKPHEHHDQHLCSLIAVGTTFDEFKKLVNEPKYVCRQCGRAANKAENLCDPAQI